MKKLSVVIANRHQTSISLEEEFLDALKSISEEKKLSLNQLITEIVQCANMKTYPPPFAFISFSTCKTSYTLESSHLQNDITFFKIPLVF